MTTTTTTTKKPTKKSEAKRNAELAFCFGYLGMIARDHGYKFGLDRRRGVDRWTLTLEAPPNTAFASYLREGANLGDLMQLACEWACNELSLG